MAAKLTCLNSLYYDGPLTSVYLVVYSCEASVANSSDVDWWTMLLLLIGSCTLQDGASLRHRCHPTRRQNAQTEDEDGSSQPHVGYLRHCLPFLLQPAIHVINVKFFCYSTRFFDLFEKYGGYKTGKLKLKKPKQLQVTQSQTSPSHVSQLVCDSLTACCSEPFF